MQTLWARVRAVVTRLPRFARNDIQAAGNDFQVARSDIEVARNDIQVAYNYALHSRHRIATTPEGP